MKKFKPIALVAWQVEPFKVYTLCYLTDWDKIFGASFGHHLYSTYQVSSL